MVFNGAPLIQNGTPMIFNGAPNCRALMVCAGEGTVMANGALMIAPDASGRSPMIYPHYLIITSEWGARGLL